MIVAPLVPKAVFINPLLNTCTILKFKGLEKFVPSAVILPSSSITRSPTPKPEPAKTIPLFCGPKVLSRLAASLH